MTSSNSTTAIPGSPGDITPTWLTAALHAGGGPSSDGDPPIVDAVEVEPIGVGIGIMSLLFRLTPTYSSGHGPASLVAKIAPPYPQVREIAAGYGFYRREVDIYRHLGPELGLRPPTVHYADYDAESDDFVLLMEDLGHLRSADQLVGCGRDDARSIVTELARHHARWWEDDRLQTLPFIQSPSEAPFPQYHDQSTKQCWPIVKERFADSIPPHIAALGDRWSEVGPAIMEDIPNHPVTLTHGDVRLDNIFFHDDGGDPVSIVDWQIAYAAGAASDLGYFMSQSLTVGDRRAHEGDLTRLYHATLVEGGVRDYPFEEFWDDYRRAILFCLCYPMSAGAVELVNDRAVQLATSMLERSIAAIDDLDAHLLAPS